ncbi:hypothetical protein [Caldilinea sp.]|nr:hypothetical protein [Caldilinea sp.]
MPACNCAARRSEALVWTFVTGILAVAFFLAAWLAWWVAGGTT